MRMTACLIVGAASLLAPWSVADEPKKTDQGQLQGTWEADATEAHGKTIRGKVSLTFSGKQFKLQSDGKETYQGTFTLDEKKSPKQVDFKVGVPGKLGGKDPVELEGRIVGIYEVTGDTLRVCWGSSPRPTAFASSKSHVLSTYRRAAK